MGAEQWVLVGVGALAYGVATPFFIMRYFLKKIADGDLLSRVAHDQVVVILKEALARRQRVEDESLESIGAGIDSMLTNQLDFQARLNGHLEREARR